MNSLNRLPLILRKLLKKPIRIRNFSSNLVAIPDIIEEINQEKSIIVNRIKNITTIGINCPEKKNSLNVATAQRLSEAIDVFEQDEEAVVGILHGYGGNFCAGFDLKEIAKYDGESEENVPHFGVLANRRSLCAKPLIACVNGYAVGAGFELALMCDLRIVEETATMGVFNRRFGIPMLCGGTVRLPAMIGYARAMELILTGRGITGMEAFNWGLATQLVPCGASKSWSRNNPCTLHY
ncbi:probable enoyl-CoA hydratase, mitochondrial isoform X2 [Cephus cinctus]|uniref:Probable enoyl-CoA hydratase, mitochondrial isoform X2 n=1 Tax=Cephus cinctus TaxID=211228 RepID=A0AAJ7W6G0_CEPCN|nr:probable enoyl-CoA hydratase, mitochondrial isoform X2 [Cephus cinctus]